MKEPDSKVLVALGEGAEKPVVILGIPAGAWDYMRGGLSHTFDLTSVGIPIQIIMFRGESYADVISTIENVAKETRMPVGGLRDLGIQRETEQ